MNIILKNISIFKLLANDFNWLDFIDLKGCLKKDLDPAISLCYVFDESLAKLIADNFSNKQF